jgi:CrcB protein
VTFVRALAWESALQKYLYIAVGGALGALARYWVGSSLAGRLGTRFPYGTFVINVTACVLLGFSLEMLGRHVELNPGWRYLIPTGFIGAYSTFSTFEWETFASLQTGGFAVAGAYVVSSVVLGLVGIWCGVLLARVVV